MATLFANQMKPLLLTNTLEQLTAVVSVQATETAANLREALTFYASVNHDDI